MAKMVEDQLKMCIQAYIDEDISKMDDVIRYEDEIDRLNNTLHSDCIAEINQNPEMALKAMSFSFIGSHLERFGDHATNIFETVYFIVTGNYMDFNDLNTIPEDE